MDGPVTATNSTRRNPGCAFGPCNDSKFVGGPGCHLCDDIATLPQRGRSALIDELASEETGMTLAQPVATKKRAQPSAKAKRMGSLFGS